MPIAPPAETRGWRSRVGSLASTPAPAVVGPLAGRCCARRAIWLPDAPDRCGSVQGVDPDPRSPAAPSQQIDATPLQRCSNEALALRDGMRRLAAGAGRGVACEKSHADVIL